ncbi:hypothetical protein VTN96DRAFT_6077 [Rasamsonia emersonii]
MQRAGRHSKGSQQFRVVAAKQNDIHSSYPASSDKIRSIPRPSSQNKQTSSAQTTKMRFIIAVFLLTAAVVASPVAVAVPEPEAAPVPAPVDEGVLEPENCCL